MTWLVVKTHVEHGWRTDGGTGRTNSELCQLTEKNATLETSQTTLHASVQCTLGDQLTSLTAKLENQQAMLINQQTTLEVIMTSVAAINQQLAPASSSRKQSASSSRKQARQTTHATMHHQTHQLSNHLPLHATPMICNT